MNTLSQRTKAGYGSADAGLAAVEFLLQLYLLYFATQVLGLSPGLAGFAIALGLVWDAISDPLMGLVLDRTRFRRGRFVPYIAAGSVALAVTLVLLFNPPPQATSTETAAFLYLLVLYLLVNTGMTILAVPHIALGGNMAFDRDERTQLYGWRLVFGNIGLLLGLLLPLAVAALFSLDYDDAGDRGVILGRTAWVLAVLLLAGSAITVAATFRHQGNRATAAPLTLSGIGRSFIHIAKNPVFLPLLLGFIAVSIARAINAAAAFYYYEFTLELSMQATVGGVLLPFVCCILASVPFWVGISRRYGKKWPAFWGLAGLGLLVSVAYPLLPPGNVVFPLLVAIPGGLAVGAIILFESLVADVVDHDELKTGQKREGLYFGFWKMGTKISRAGGIVLAGAALEMIGFDPSTATQEAETAFRLALLFGPGVGGFFLLGAIVFAFFPLTDTRHRRVQELLQRRRSRH